MKVIARGLSDVGLARERNEDSFAIEEDFHLFVVADGMGGHRAGDVASQMATEAMISFFRATQAEDTTWPFHFDPTMSIDENRLVTAIKVANRKIFETSRRDREARNMGTTVVSAVLSRRRPRAYIAHVGDSRCYRIRRGEIKQLTRDHSLLNDYLLFMPEMTRERQEEIPKNVITRALGMQDAVMVDLQADRTENGDVYLLCSDGLSGMVPDEELLEAVTAAGDDLEFAAKDLIRRANAHGGEDNITAVLFKVDDLPAEPEPEKSAEPTRPRGGRDEIAGARTAEMPAVADPNEAPKEDIGRAKTLEMEVTDAPSKPPAKKRSGRRSAPPPKKRGK